MPEPFCGAVLTGGTSTRMGTDKAGLMAAAVEAALMAAGADPVLRIGRDVADRGPLDGVRAALASSPREVVVVLACDLPDASPDGIRMVVDALDASVAVPVVGGRREPLHAAWRRATALPVVEAALASGERAIHPVLAALGAREVHGLDPAWVRNVNTPADLRHGVAMEEIDVTELARRHGEGGYVLDVRQPDEYEAGHVPGATLIPLDQLGARIDEVPKDVELNVICKSGGRSATAVDALTQAGYRAVNVAGGTMAWIEAGNPTNEGSAP